MIHYEDKGLSFVPLKWKALINITNIILALLILCCITLGFIDDLWFFFWFLSFIILISICIRLFMTRKAQPIMIETLENSLRIVYRKYFSVEEISILNEEVNIEFYESPHRQYHAYYLYFYSQTDKRIDIELNHTLYTIGKILDSIYTEQKILLAPQELTMIEKYRSQLEWNKTTQGKVLSALYVLLSIGIAAIAVYMCTGK